MFKDPKIESLIHQELVRQTGGIELIASENYASESVMNASGSILTNKYAEGLPNKRYYGGCKVVDEIEKLDIFGFTLLSLFISIMIPNVERNFKSLYFNSILKFITKTSVSIYSIYLLHPFIFYDFQNFIIDIFLRFVLCI
jgi:hypothetical protein